MKHFFVKSGKKIILSCIFVVISFEEVSKKWWALLLSSLRHKLWCLLPLSNRRAKQRKNYKIENCCCRVFCTTPLLQPNYIYAHLCHYTFSINAICNYSNSLSLSPSFPRVVLCIRMHTSDVFIEQNTKNGDWSSNLLKNQEFSISYFRLLFCFRHREWLEIYVFENPFQTLF